MATTDENIKVDIPRRGRMRYTADQLKKLEDAFTENHYPDSQTQDRLVADLGVTVDRIHVWFQNRRSKFKRQSKTDHVMWMRKQVFDTEDRKGPSLLFGTPRLPALTSSCHVLSPPDTTQCGRQDTAWESPSASLDIKHSPSIDFNPVLDLRTCVSQETRPVSTPKSTNISYLPRQTPTPATESRYLSNTFSDVSLSPCRYSTPSPVSTPPIAHKTFLPPAHVHSFPRKMLSPVGYHGEIPGSHSNRADFYDNSSFGSPGNIQGFYGNVNDSAFNINQFPWFSSPFLPVSMTTRDSSSALRQDVKTLDGPSSAQGHYAFNSDSSA